MTRVIVTTSFSIYDTFRGELCLNKDDIIEYERYNACDDKTFTAIARIRIFSFRAKIMYDVPDFIIEGYVQNISEPLPKTEPPKHIQIQRIEGQGNTNDFLLGIPREDVIDIKPMEHNTCLVIYAEEEHEENII